MRESKLARLVLWENSRFSAERGTNAFYINSKFSKYSYFVVVNTIIMNDNPYQILDDILECYKDDGTGNFKMKLLTSEIQQQIKDNKINIDQCNR